MAIMDVGPPNGRALAAHASGFRIDFVHDWKRAAASWAGGDYGTVFQDHCWLEAWYGAFADAHPLMAIVTDGATDRQVALVPLILRVRRGVRIVEFADLNVTDYNAPLLGFGVSLDPAESRQLCQALLRALRGLPGGVDLLRLQKMPAIIEGRPNPLACLGRPGSCSLNGNLVVTGDDFELYRASIKRMQIPRSWRVFDRNPGAAFKMIERVEDALGILDVIDAQQQARMRKLGRKFVLNDRTHGRFYRDLVVRGLEHGYAVVSALSCDEAVVAAVLGIRRGDYFVFLRISNGGSRWTNCSPSRLVAERTMAALHAGGVRKFDLSIGNHDFKRRFGAVQMPLVDASVAVGWRGIPHALRDYAARFSRRHGRLYERMRRVPGMRTGHEESK
jgi:CelD/BcsL family acetyltransferase involved in cellulose biosynthesis